MPAFASMLLLAAPGLAVAQMPGGSPAGGGLSVAPVQLSLAGESRSTSTIISNPGGDPVTVQVRLFGWTMNGDEEVYTPATDIGYSPPLFRLSPGGAQAVRVLAKAPPGPVERSYRLIVDQLPLAGAGGQLQLPVRMILPVFVAPAAGVPRSPVLAWSARRDPRTGAVHIAVSNRGAVHAKFTELAVGDGTKQTVIAPGLAGYALAGAERTWTWQAAAVPETVTITVREGGRLLRVTVPLTQR